ncbi:MAG: bicyclomycin resistance protein [Pelomonas sp.]|nr:bicyclomycin resistance protein [Roseateles sp.]
MCRLLAVFAAGLFIAATAPARAAAPPPAPKVLRYAFRVAESSFDPTQATDVYSRIVIAGIFDTAVRYGYLARPVRLEPGVTEGLPEIRDDATRFVFHIRPGIHFAADPAFHGRRRELVAADLAYTIERHYDPRAKSGHLYKLIGADILGLQARRDAALKNGRPFDYDTPVEGLRLVDRYTLEVRTGHPEPHLLYQFADPMLGILAREVVAAYGARVGDHPVGTGAWRLAGWQRSARIVLEKNPDYRVETYHEPVPAGDPALAAQVRALQGRRLPLIDRVEFSIIEEAQPRMLSFLQGQYDLLEQMPEEYTPQYLPHGRLAPALARQGLRAVVYPHGDTVFSYFNMEDPVVGGYDAAHVALRRAISLAQDAVVQVERVRRGRALPAQAIIAPELYGYDPALKTEMSRYDPARAKALLDLYGYVDRDGDGWREQPDGSPLVIEYATQSDSLARALAELFEKYCRAIGVRVKFRIAQWPENLKAANAGRLQMWGISWSVDYPDGENLLSLGYGPSAGQSNKARFRLPAYDALYERQHRLPDGPERLRAMQDAERLLVAYLPYKLDVHRIFTDLAQPWLIGFDRNLYVRDFWTYVDIDAAAQARARP